MGRYILKRLLLMIVVVVGVAVIIFTIMYLVPGDPAKLRLGTDAPEEQLAEMRTKMGIDKPYFEQLGSFLTRLFLHGDLGTSWLSGREVGTELLSRFPRTATIAFFSMLFVIALGIPLGITAAVHQSSLIDTFCMVVSLLGVSMPGFWLGLMLVLLFSVRLGWLPASGLGTPLHYILPCLSCGLEGMASMARQTRSSMLEVIHSDYIVTARAKGVPEHKVIYKHALKNALIPIITVAGSSFGLALGGTIVIETVFSVPGVGMYVMNAVSNRDYPVVRGSIVLLALVFSIVMLLVDLIYAFADPRIKARYAKGGKK